MSSAISRSSLQGFGPLACAGTPQPQKSKRVLVIGGTGRVGSSAAVSLVRDRPDLDVVLAGRDPSRYATAVRSNPTLGQTTFRQFDVCDQVALTDAVSGADLVVHTAGPFQRQDRCSVLETALETGTAYLDVCDDTRTTQLAKQLHPLAIRRSTPAIVGGGVYPGLSNVMATHIISANKKEYDENGMHQEPDADADVVSVERIRYSYFTAGSGGAGQTLMVTSLMLLGEPVVAFRDGRRVVAQPMSQPTTVDFGPGIGRRGVYLINLPEAWSGHSVLGAANCSARFGTSPPFWNWLLWGLARAVDPSSLQNQETMTKLAAFSMPVISLVDRFVGEAVGIRVDLEFNDKKAASGIYVHPKLSESVGTCISAFAQCLLNGETAPGVWLPEEKSALLDRRNFLKNAAKGCQRLILNRPAWQIESEPTRIGLGLYVY